MSVVACEVESVHGAPTEQRLVFYRCQDSDGEWHSYGPVITIDPNFDVEGLKQVVTAKVAESLAAAEFEAEIG
jgi:hypothetical protein